MADLFEIAVDFILSVEGGLVDDPSDPGGLTKFGISQRAYPDLNIRDLTAGVAKDLYRQDYWNRCSCDKLPAGIAFVVFDAAVNTLGRLCAVAVSGSRRTRLVPPAGKGASIRSHFVAPSSQADDEMEKIETLGQFEQLVLTAVYLLRGEGYTINIKEQVDELAGRRNLTGGVFTTLSSRATWRPFETLNSHLISVLSPSEALQGPDVSVVAPDAARRY